MEPKFVNKPAFTVVGMMYRGKNEVGEIPQLWGKLMPRAGEITHINERYEAYGVADNFDQESGEFSYLAGYAVSKVEELPEGMVSWDVPEGRYAVFTCTLPTLMETIHTIYRTWLPESEYKRSDAPEFEFYSKDFDGDDDNSPMYYYVPIE
jgi:AraC family transcriptional regulator